MLVCHDDYSGRRRARKKRLTKQSVGRASPHQKRPTNPALGRQSPTPEKNHLPNSTY